MELHDPLTYPQMMAYLDYVDEAEALRENGKGAIPELRLHSMMLPSIIGFVKEWNLENFPAEVTVDTFPASPLLPSSEVLNWIQSEITLLLGEKSEVPNE